MISSSERGRGDVWYPVPSQWINRLRLRAPTPINNDQYSHLPELWEDIHAAAARSSTSPTTTSSSSRTEAITDNISSTRPKGRRSLVKFSYSNHNLVKNIFLAEPNTVGSRYNDILCHPKKYRYNEIIVITRIICIEDNTLFYFLKKSVMCFWIFDWWYVALTH